MCCARASANLSVSRSSFCRVAHGKLFYSFSVLWHPRLCFLCLFFSAVLQCLFLLEHKKVSIFSPLFFFVDEPSRRCISDVRTVFAIEFLQDSFFPDIVQPDGIHPLTAASISVFFFRFSFKEIRSRTEQGERRGKFLRPCWWTLKFSPKTTFPIQNPFLCFCLTEMQHRAYTKSSDFRWSTCLVKSAVLSSFACAKLALRLLAVLTLPRPSHLVTSTYHIEETDAGEPAHPLERPDRRAFIPFSL